MEEKKRSLEQNIKQLRTAREKLVVRLQGRNKSEIAMKANKDQNNHVEIGNIMLIQFPIKRPHDQIIKLEQNFQFTQVQGPARIIEIYLH